jgi:hypothetical protein
MIALIFFIILIFYYINKYSVEKFTSGEEEKSTQLFDWNTNSGVSSETDKNMKSIQQGYSAQPVDWNKQWGNSSGMQPLKKNKNNTCSNKGETCVLNLKKNKYGICSDNLECIPLIIETTMEEEEEEVRREEVKTEESRDYERSNKAEEEEYPEGCYSNNSNFYEICNEQDSTYGVKRIINCTKGSSVECAKGYINGEYYGNKIVTPCLNKKDDFDSWCRYYNTNPIPDGFNINSIGASEILIGEQGDCYVNGVSDTNSARAVCDYNHIDSVKRLEPDFNSIDYNDFTTCFPLQDTNFNAECALELKQPYKNVIADQIAGYDCNPGYGRAKCVKRSDKAEMEKAIFDKYPGFWGEYDPTNSTVSCNNSCC